LRATPWEDREHRDGMLDKMKFRKKKERQADIQLGGVKKPPNEEDYLEERKGGVKNAPDRHQEKQNKASTCRKAGHGDSTNTI